MISESKIRHENGSFWVFEDRNAFTVYKAGITHSKPDSSYAPTDDGLSLAVYRCDYLAKREILKRSGIEVDHPLDRKV
jgi:hypothetical protein